MLLSTRNEWPEAGLSTGRVAAFWCRIPRRPNFGDALTPWFLRRLSGHYPAYVPADDPREKYFVTGSIMEYSCASCTVWGAGIMALHDPISAAAKFLAVRG